VYAGAFACVAVLINHVTLMRRTLFSFLASLAPPNILTLSHKRYDFGKKLLNIKCAF
jgi:hypothetical protein